MLRSPNKERSASNPDVSSMNKPTLVQTCLTKCVQRKRQLEEESFTDRLDSFSLDISMKLASLKSDFTLAISELMNDIKTNIKSDLASITLSISELRDGLNAAKTEYNGIADCIKDMINKQLLITSELSDIKTSLEFTMNKQTELENKVKKIDDNSRISQTMETELAELRLNIQELKHEIQQHDQWERVLNLEINGVPETKNEDLLDITIKIAKYAEVDLQPEDIAHTTRIKPRQNNSGHPKSIIVKLKNRLHKDNILANIRKKRGLSTLDISMVGESRRIFVNEHLTVANKILHKKCREIAKSKSYQYVWIKNCKLFVKKNENSPVIYIKNELDLCKIH